MKRSWPIWIGFGLCLAVVLTAMGWISLKALGLDDAEAEARREEALARHEESLARYDEAQARRQVEVALRQVRASNRRETFEDTVRTALWRMEPALAPLVAQESARPYFAYSAFLPLDRAYSRMFNGRANDDVLVPSPLLSGISEHVRVYFQFEPDGTITSPQVPERGNNWKLAIGNSTDETTILSAQEWLDEVGDMLDRDELLRRLPESVSHPLRVVSSPVSGANRVAQIERRNDSQARGRAAVEYNQRQQVLEQNTNAFFQGQFANNGILNNPIDVSLIRNEDGNLLLPSTDVSGVLMTPLWVGEELVLARRVAVNGREYVQGCLLDWPAISEWLLEMVDDLLPEASFQPVTGPPEEDPLRMLASVPARLIPGPEIVEASAPLAPLPPLPELVAAATRPTLSPIRLSLAVAWTCVLLAAVAVAVLLWGVMRLSERRAAFVTAVTHELRTPLTTFQMYAEMLSEDMVPEPQRKGYLRTLSTEASRLTHLVENVLSYARLERGRSDGRIESIGLEQLVDPAVRRLADRATQAGMQLIVETEPGSGDTVVRANPSAVEQILFNLVDNACKYAVGAEDKRIHLGLSASNGTVQVTVADHGPGVSRGDSRRLFRSFSKTAHEAAHSAPGVGLGLALSRRLADDMGGNLQLDETATDGARFVFTLAADGAKAV